jgi:phosphopantothenoylcysteine decarboxylase/phosphopantothenate--cysteine ligase
MHPSQDLFGQKSNKLSGKAIILGVTGSIAAVETVKLIHEMLRHGAQVIPVMTKAATEILDPNALLYASGIEPITKLTGEIEHVKYCGQTKSQADLLLIAPCTANTISKIANGIDDTTVTTFATTAIGSKIPILILPAMHGSMYEHPIIQKNINKLENKKLNIEFLQPTKSENKYKLPSNEEIIAHIIRKLWRPDLKNKRVLIISGATVEKIDDMRILTNRSTGATGVALAEQAYLRGAEVSVWVGNSTKRLSSYLDTQYFQSTSELKVMVSNLTGSGKNFYDIIIVCAAISDYTMAEPKKGKITSGKKALKLELKPTDKIIPIIVKRSPKSFLVGYKAEAKIKETELLNRAKDRLVKWKLNMIVANDLENVTEDKTKIIIINSNLDSIKKSGKKSEIAEAIFDQIIKG